MTQRTITWKFEPILLPAPIIPTHACGEKKIKIKQNKILVTI